MSNLKNVVGIGASAGGLEAIQQLFDNLPDNTGMSFVIIQHLSPNFKSLMPELLSKHTQMKIFTAKSGQALEPNCIYLNDKDSNLSIKDQKFFQKERETANPLNLPIDLFLHSLAKEFSSKAMAIILSGTGTDGSRGIRSIKEESGTIIAQEPKSAQFDGMPNASIITNLVDYVLAPDKIAEELVEISGKSSIISERIVEITDTIENELNVILEEIYKLTGIDFRQYKRNTLIRRLDKRMTVNRIPTIKRYRDYLIRNPEEKEILKNDFLIGVTSFFRDVEAFKLIDNKVISELISNAGDGEIIRIWVAGCSSGEEAYSIAIRIMEQLQRSERRTDFKIFATDVDIASLRIAGTGTYPVNIASDISQDLLDKYFTRTGEKYKIIKRVREKIVFSYHNIIKDPPFVRQDMISCRNLLIYLNNAAQRRILANFQFALKTYGYLFLGNSESLGDLQKYFRVINSKWKIFQNISDSKVLPGLSSSSERMGYFGYESPLKNTRRTLIAEQENIDYSFYKVLSEMYAPSCLVVDEEFNLLFMLGEMKKYLQFPDGAFENNLLNLLPNDLKPVIRGGIRKITAEDSSYIIRKIKISVEKQTVELSLVFRLVRKEHSDRKFYLIEFEDEKKIKKASLEKIPGRDYNNTAKQHILELENELSYAKSELQNVIEELETSNEELQSSNEELLASNEELQNTNEELQSVNEELHTVNSELQDRNEDLFLLNSDMNNLLNSTDIGTLFLDRNLNIRKFTPSLMKHFNLREEDIGRPIGSFVFNFDEGTRKMIISDSQIVLEKSVTLEKEISDLENNYYLKRINPFITPHKRTNGVVITLTNINILKRTQKELEYRKNLLSNIIEYLPGALVFLFDRNLTLIIADGQELKNGLIDTREYKGRKLEELFSEVDYETLMTKFEEAFEKRERTSFETRIKQKDFFMNAIPIGQNGNDSENLLVLAVDATDIKKTEAELMKLNQAIFQAPSPIVLTNLKGAITYVNPKFTEITGYDKDELIGKSTNILKSGSHDKAFYSELWKTIKKGDTWKGEFLNRKKFGETYWELASISPLKNKQGEVTGFVKVAEDVTDRKKMEIELEDAKEKAEIANIYKNNFLANMSHEIRTPMNGIIGFSNLLKDREITSEEKAKYISIIHGNSMQLLNLIDDIIDISKIEAGELKISKGECYLNQIVNELKIMFEHEKSFINKSQLSLELIVPENTDDLVIYTDPMRLKQILTNLISNSIKFTEKGYVKFGYEIKKNKIWFFVKDTGIGIAKNKLEAIFERFEQSEIELSKKYGGTGLGLTISKGLATLLGGRIGVESEKGQGAKFWFEIPLKLVGRPKRIQKNSFPVNYFNLKERKILLVEDDDLIYEFVKIVLKPHRVKLIRSANGRSAIRHYQRDKRFDLILMDLGLPDIDGYSVTREILKIDPKAKIIAQSAYAMQVDMEKSYDAGCLDYISKPINTQLLLSKMSTLLAK